MTSCRPVKHSSWLDQRHWKLWCSR